MTGANRTSRDRHSTRTEDKELVSPLLHEGVHHSAALDNSAFPVTLRPIPFSTDFQAAWCCSLIKGEVVMTTTKVDKLKAACSDAFFKFPNSCSHAVWHVLRQYIPNQPYLNANHLIASIESNPRVWREVDQHDLSKLAKDGFLVVGGAVEVPNGHVIVVYPGEEKFSGGYSFKEKATGKTMKAYPNGVYALAMSTSMGGWPGAVSNGDKTVFDPWGAKKFKKVRFWMYVGSQL